MNLLLIEPLKPHWMQVLQNFCSVIVCDSPAENDILRHAGTVDAIVIRAKGRLSSNVIAAFAPRLKVIGRHGTGVDHIDLVSASEHSVVVVNTPHANVRATAEFTVALMLNVGRKVLRGDKLVRENQDWRLADQLTGFDFSGKQIGLLGFGRIGQAVGKICSGGFGMQVAYWDHKGRDVSCEYPAKKEEFESLLRGSDIVSLHLPAISGTSPLVGRKELAMLRRGTIFINTARGQLVDEEALTERLKSGEISAGLDVMTVEPLRSSQLQTLDNTVLTPHMASYTSESFYLMGEVVEDVIRVLTGEPPRNPVVSR